MRTFSGSNPAYSHILEPQTRIIPNYLSAKFTNPLRLIPLLAIVLAITLATAVAWLPATSEAQAPPPATPEAKTVLPTPTPIPQDGDKVDDEPAGPRTTPRITIARYQSPVEEGNRVDFILTASSAPGSNLDVNVSVTDNGNYVNSTIPSIITIAGATTTAWLILYTQDDSVDEPDAFVTATVLSGTGYYLGSTYQDSVLVEDNDLGPPSNLSLAVETDDDNDLDLTYTRSESPHYYQFQLHRAGVENGVYTLVNTVWDVFSPADFDNRAYGFWFQARGRNCENSNRTSCGAWSVWSNKVHLSNLQPPTNLNLTGSNDDLTLSYTRTTGSTHYYQFQLEQASTEYGTYSDYGSPANDSFSPAYFNNVTRDRWYQGKARNCRDSARTDCGNWGPPTSPLRVPPETVTLPSPPTGLSLAPETNDPNDLDLSYTRSQSPHYYLFELHSSSTQYGTYGYYDDENDSISPANFDNVTRGRWYKGRGKNCQNSNRTSCGSWSAWSNAVNVATTSTQRPPSFGQASYSFDVSEDAALNHVVGTVTATDPDAGDTVSYSITAGNSDGDFSVGSSSGQIKVAGSLDSSTTSTYTLTVQASDGTRTATATATINVDEEEECETSLGTLTETTTHSGSWTSDCDSVNRSGKYAKFITFTLSQETNVQIDLVSSTDPYLFLLSGAGQNGSVLEQNDDADGLNSRITRTLSAGSYTAEATTYGSAATGNFTLTITGPGATLDDPGAPQGLSVPSTTATGITLTWTDITGADKYRLQRKPVGHGQWTTVNSNIQTNSYSSTGLTCGTFYAFQVAAYGDGTTLAESWGPWSISHSASTGACNQLPSFAQAAYSFSVLNNAANGTSVGTVSATDPDTGDTVTYSITGGNTAGKFAINSSTGAITVASALGTATYTLTVQVSDGNGGTDTATVTITATVPVTAFAFTPSPMGLGDSSNVWDVPNGTTDVYLDVNFSIGIFKDTGAGDINVQRVNSHGTVLSTHTVHRESDSGELENVDANSTIRIDVDNDAFDLSLALVTLTFHSGTDDTGPVIAQATVQKEAQPYPPNTGSASYNQTNNTLTLTWSAGANRLGATPDHFEVVIPDPNNPGINLYSNLNVDDSQTNPSLLISSASTTLGTGGGTAEVRHCNAAGGCSTPLQILFTVESQTTALGSVDISLLRVIPGK